MLYASLSIASTLVGDRAREVRLAFGAAAAYTAGGMITFSLQSGSNGNCIYVEAGDIRLLFDAGISGKQAAMRMASRGRNIRDCDALIISHDHADHTRCAGIFQRKFGLPIYITRPTLQEAQPLLGPVRDVRLFSAGDRLTFGDVTVHTIRAPHDAVDTVCFVVQHDGRRLGVLTDLGHPFAALRSTLDDVDAAYLESNYDPEMLQKGSYPEWLKDRIAGDGGHISNEEAAALISHSAARRLKWAAIAHLSEENNRPSVAIATHRRLVGRSFPLHLASRYEVSEVFEV
jgi:phosphoribosyl 1,2-cyclic phosphodiesterase